MSVGGTIRASSTRRRICDMLISEITSGHRPAGSRLPSVRRLAERFGTSISPVYQALQTLQEEGYVTKRGGSGTYIADNSPVLTLAQTVALGLSQRAHVWGDLDLMLAQRLQAFGMNPLMLDVESQNSQRRLQSVTRSDVRALVLRGQGGVSMDRLRALSDRGKVILGLVESRGEPWPGLLRVLTDPQHGGELVAEHLWQRGHRHVAVVVPRRSHVIASPDDSPFEQHQPWHGQAFAAKWEALGGRWSMVVGEGWQDQMPILNREGLLVPFDERDPATAVFGTMDVMTLGARRVLREHWPALAASLDFVGYYDTPWSQAGDPPFTSVNLNLPELAEQACDALMQALLGGTVEPALRVVSPRIVAR